MTAPHPITRALLSAMMHSTEPMVLSDPGLSDHPMVAVNPAFEALTGFASAAITGRNCRFLQGAETDPATTGRIRRCIDEQKGCIEWVLNYRADGSKFWNLLFISPVFAPDGTLLHFFGNQRDISNRLPEGLPDYTLGRADMPLQGQQEFQAVLLDILVASPVPGQEAVARELERIIEAARRLNDVTTRLTPPAWKPYATA